MPVLAPVLIQAAPSTTSAVRYFPDMAGTQGTQKPGDIRSAEDIRSVVVDLSLLGVVVEMVRVDSRSVVVNDVAGQVTWMLEPVPADLVVVVVAVVAEQTRSKDQTVVC